MAPALPRSRVMVPILLALLFGFGVASGLVLGFLSLWKRVTQPETPLGTRMATGAFGAAGLSLLGLFGGAVFTVLLATTSLTALVEHGPVRAVEVMRLDDRLAGLEHQALCELTEDAPESYREAALYGSEYTVHVLVEYEGNLRVDRLERFLARETHGEVELLGAEGMGNGNLQLHFGLDVDQHDVEHLEDSLHLALPGTGLPHQVRFEIDRP